MRELDRRNPGVKEKIEAKDWRLLGRKNEALAADKRARIRDDYMSKNHPPANISINQEGIVKAVRSALRTFMTRARTPEEERKAENQAEIDRLQNGEQK